MLRNAEEATAKLQAEKLDLQAQRDELQAVRLHTSQQIDDQLIKCHRPANLQVPTMRHVHICHTYHSPWRSQLQYHNL